MSKFFLVLICASINSLAFGHGEDKLGPHGGYVRMPGSFHTEVILAGSHGLKVYLLDINWKNPSVQNSSLRATHKKTQIAVVCKVNSDHYLCQFPKKVDLKKKGELSLEPQREGQIGNTVSYDLPLRLQKTDGAQGSHH